MGKYERKEGKKRTAKIYSQLHKFLNNFFFLFPKKQSVLFKQFVGIYDKLKRCVGEVEDDEERF